MRPLNIAIAIAILFCFLAALPACNAADRFDRANFSFRAHNVLEEAGHCEINVSVGFVYDAPFTIRYRLVPKTASADSDFVPSAGILSWGARFNEITKQLPLELLDDHLADGNKTFDIEFFDFSLDPSLTTTTTVTIIDGEVGYSLVEPEYALENDVCDFVIRRVGDFDIASSVDLIFSPQDPPTQQYMIPAEPGIDYIDAPVTVSFLAGQQSATAQIRIPSDSTLRPGRQLRITLANPSLGVPIISGPSSGILNIWDDDYSYFYPKVSSGSYDSIVEGSGEFLILQRFGPFDSAFVATVEFRRNFFDSAASPDVDFEARSATVEFAPGQREAAIPLSIIDDDEVEPTETFHVYFPETPVSREPFWIALKIIDNDHNPLPFTTHCDPEYQLNVINVVPVRDSKLLIYYISPSQNQAVLRRIEAMGSPDQTFVEHHFSYHALSAIRELANGKILLRKQLVPTNPNSLTLVRLNADGALDPSFQPPSGRLGLFAPAPNDKTYVVRDNTLILLNADGSIDPGFTSPAVPGTTLINAVADSTARLFLCGTFTAINEISCPGLAAILPTGELDSNFAPTVTLSDPSYPLTLWDDRLFVLLDRPGFLSEYHRLLPNGAIDPAFTPMPGFGAYFQHPQGGFFNIGPSYAGSYINRLNPDGSADPAFRATVPFVGGAVYMLSDGNLFVLGNCISNIQLQQQPNAILPKTALRISEEGGEQTLDFIRLIPNRSARAVAYSFRDGSAKRGVHFSAQDGQLIFPAGISDRSIRLAAIDNSDIAPTGTFFIDFFSADGTPVGAHEISISQRDASLDFSRLTVLPDGRWRVPVVNNTENFAWVWWSSDLVHWFPDMYVGGNGDTYTFRPLPLRFYRVAP